MKKIGLIAIFVAFLTSCAATWTYDNQNYTTSAQAIEAARADMRGKLNSVTPLENAVKGSILVYTPSVNWSRNAVLVTGAASEEQIRYIATVLYYGFYAMAEGVKKRNIIETVDIKEFSQRDPLSAPSYDYILWARVDNPDSSQWMISPGSDTSSPTPIYTSPISDGGDRINAFVGSVSEYIAKSK
ncbi:MAG: hypothetical protein AB8C02_09710 [Halioglobus sp.]